MRGVISLCTSTAHANFTFLEPLHVIIGGLILRLGVTLVHSESAVGLDKSGPVVKMALVQVQLTSVAILGNHDCLVMLYTDIDNQASNRGTCIHSD